MTTVTTPAASDHDAAGRLAKPEGAGQSHQADADVPREVEALILGAGVSGMCAAIALKREGVGDFVIVDRANGFGGTWRHNTYPGCAVDIPSHLYSFSFALNPDWGRLYVEQPELKRYLEDTAVRFKLHEQASLGTELLDARWDDGAQRWHVATTTGTFSARIFVVAAGPLHDPAVPELPGLSRFKGPSFHSANWRPDLDLDGKRVAVVGTGASAVQFIPRIQPRTGKLIVFQRTPGWVLPKLDWRTSRFERSLLKRVPRAMRAYRALLWANLDGMLVVMVRHPRIARLVGALAGGFNIRRAVDDPALRRVLTPDYVVTCKRAMFSNEYYPALAAPNVEVVPHAVEEVREHSVIAADGKEHEVDAIIFGTGFHVLTTHPIAERIHGRTDQSLADYWDGRPRAFMGTSIPSFPNLFMMFGPNIGTLSGFVMAEAQVDYITAAIRAMRSAGLESIDVREQAVRRFNAEVDRRMEGTTLSAGGCTSYYLDESGRVALAWPWTMATMRRRLRTFDMAAYEARVATSTPPVAGARTAAAQ